MHKRLAVPVRSLLFGVILVGVGSLGTALILRQAVAQTQPRHVDLVPIEPAPKNIERRAAKSNALDSPESDGMPRPSGLWEYKIIFKLLPDSWIEDSRLCGEGKDEAQAQLNLLAIERWELVTATQAGLRVRYVLRRERR